MTSNTISPSIDQGALQIFQDSFYELSQQTESQLVRTGSIMMANQNGKTTHFGRIGRLELVQVDARNPDKQYGDYALDNRQFSKKRFTLTVQIDAKQDVNELLKDPTSNILKQLYNASERVTDRIAVAAAVGNVLVGAPDTTPTSITAASDGVRTVVATAGMTYGTVQEVTENFINNEVPMSVFSGATLCVTGSENTDLMGETEFINNMYITAATVESGVMKKAGGYQVAMFAGSKNGGITVLNPILPEASTTRQCVVLAPNSILMSKEVNILDVSKSATKVNSWDLTIDLWINAMRVEGVLVQIITTTI